MSQHSPLFSIVIPTRNRAHLLPYALRSALEQDFDDYEIVVVANDCRDNTRAVVEAFRDTRIRYYETDTMLSMPDNWDFAWTKARGVYVTYLPDDDALVPSALRFLAERALDGNPPVVSWEDAPYYYPDWHDPDMRNLLLLSFSKDRVIEDVPAEVYRRQCADFSFAWSSPLPKMLNCVANREQLEGWRQKLGRLFFPAAPDYAFAWTVSHVFPSIRVVHRPLSVRGISDHSIGSNAGLGAAGAEFLREFGDLDPFAEAPFQIPTTLNLLAATFFRVNNALREHQIPVEPLVWKHFLIAVAKQLREPESERYLTNLPTYISQLLDSAASVSSQLRSAVEKILSAPAAAEANGESIRDVRDRTVQMALEYAPNVAKSTDDHLGDEQCGRCVLGLEKGLLAGPTWDNLYVFGDEIGANDPYAMSQLVDQYYEDMLRCRQKNLRIRMGEGSTAASGAPPQYDQSTEFHLLTTLLAHLDTRTVLDVGAERGSFTRALLAAGAERIYAFEPHPTNVTALRTTFGHIPAVQIFDMALGDRNGEAQLHLVEDKTGQLDDAYHSLVEFTETPSLRMVGEISVQCRTLGSLVDEGAIPPEIGILKIDTERGDFAILQGMGALTSAVVMVEFWDDLPDTVGPSPYRLADVVSFMATRGYPSFVVIKRHDEFETLQINTAETQPGDWGNVVFLHETVSPRVSAVLFEAVSQAQARLVEQAAFFADEARKRLDNLHTVRRAMDKLQRIADERGHVLEEVSRAADERGKMLEEVSRVADERGKILEEVHRAAETHRRIISKLQRADEERLTTIEELRSTLSQAVVTRMEMLEEQELALEAYLQSSRDDGLWTWVQPQLGVLHQHTPVPFHVPEHYLHTVPLSEPPTISIVTPTLNAERFLPFTFQSVLDQEYPNVEYVVQDGGSTDATLSIIEQARAQLAYTSSERDNGMAQAINRGFRHTTGEIMAYLNADDLLLPGTLQLVAAYFAQHPEVDVVYGHRVLIDSDNAEIGRWVMPRHDDAVLSWADFIPQETLFWRRSIWEKAGGQMDETFKFALDWDLLLRFREAGAQFVRLPRFLAAFRVHAEQKTSAELSDLGSAEMERLRTRHIGRSVTGLEISQHLAEYLRRHKVYHKLYRLGVLRY